MDNVSDKKILILCSVIWLIGVVLLVLETTDVFQESLTTPIKGLIGGSFALVFGLSVRYFNNKKKEN